MPLETIRPDARPKIQKLSTETPEKDIKTFDFDINIYVNKDDLKRRLDSLNNSRQPLEWHYFAHKAVQLKYMFPEITPHLDLDNEAFENFKKEWEEDIRKKNWPSACKLAMEFKILFPDRFPELEMDIYWKNIKEEFIKEVTGHYFEYPMSDNSADLAKSMKIVYPEKMNKFLKDEKIYQRMKKRLEDLREKSIYQFINQAADMKILFPDKIEALLLKNNIVIKMFEELEAESINMKNEKPGHDASHAFYVLALNMQILSNQGIDIDVNNQKDYQGKIPPTPNHLDF